MGGWGWAQKPVGARAMPTDRQTDIQTGIQTGIQTDIQIERHTDR